MAAGDHATAPSLTGLLGAYLFLSSVPVLVNADSGDMRVIAVAVRRVVWCAGRRSTSWAGLARVGGPLPAGKDLFTRLVPQ